MAKISTYPSADVPLLLSDRLIGTEAIRPIPSPTPLATKNFSLGELLQFFQSQITVTTDLQSVLNAGNTATQNINLTGTIDATLIKPVNIEDTSGSQGTVFQVLSKGAVSITWANVPIDNLQAVLNAGNTATQNITLIGDITSTKIIPGNIQDDTSAIGTTGQFLSKTASGIRWVNAPVATTPSLGDVVSVGNVTLQDIYASSFYTNTGYALMDDGTLLGNIFQFANGFNSYIQYSGSGFNVWDLPDQTGTIALLSDITAATNLDAVLANGNVSQLDAKIGELYLWDSVPTTGYAKISGNKNRIQFYGKTGAYGWGFIAADTYVLQDTLGNQFQIRKPAGTLSASSYVATFQMASGTIAYLSDIPTSPLTTKGDLYTFDTAPARLPVGLDTQILIADSTTPTGLKWGSNSAPVPLGYYGQYFDYDDQNAVTNNIGVAMRFGTPDLSNGITVTSDGTNLTKITFANSGVYNLQFSTQFENDDNAPQDIFIWLRKNGITGAFDVPGSMGTVGMEARKNPGDPYHTIVTWNFLLDILAGDFYQIVWATTDVVNVGIRFNAGTVNYPSTVSTLFTVTQQSGIMAGTGVTNVSAVMTNPSQTVVVTNPTTIPEITIDDTNFMYNKFFVNQYAYLLPSDVNINWDSLRVGGTLLVTGTNTALSENPMGQRFATATAVSSVAGFFGTNFGSTAFFGVNFTFDFSYRFRFGTNNGAQRFFAGLSQMYGTATPTNIEPTAMINSIGVAKLQGSANLFFIWNDATGTASSLDLGSGFLGTDTASTYRIRIWKTSGIPVINIQLTKVVNSTGVTTTTSVLTITSDYNTGVNHYAAIWMGNNTAATGAVSFKNYGCELSKRNVINA